MGLEALLDALECTYAGEIIIYHQGFLARDRDFHNPHHKYGHAPEIHACAEVAYLVGSPKTRDEATYPPGWGAAHLVSRRITLETYEYLLKMRRPLGVTELRQLREFAARVKRAATEERKVALERDRDRIARAHERAVLEMAAKRKAAEAILS